MQILPGTSPSQTQEVYQPDGGGGGSSSGSKEGVGRIETSGLGKEAQAWGRGEDNAQFSSLQGHFPLLRNNLSVWLLLRKHVFCLGPLRLSELWAQCE